MYLNDEMTNKFYFPDDEESDVSEKEWFIYIYNYPGNLWYLNLNLTMNRTG